jgi:hypothetical protein
MKAILLTFICVKERLCASTSHSLTRLSPRARPDERGHYRARSKGVDDAAGLPLGMTTQSLAADGGLETLRGGLDWGAPGGVGSKLKD